MRLALLVLVAAPLACSSLGPMPSCGDVYRLRPEELGHVVCSMPADPGRSREATARAQARADQREAVKQGTLDAARAIRAGDNP